MKTIFVNEKKKKYLNFETFCLTFIKTHDNMSENLLTKEYLKNLALVLLKDD